MSQPPPGEEEDDQSQHVSFPGDQEDWEAAPEAMKNHLWNIVAHKAGLGPKPPNVAHKYPFGRSPHERTGIMDHDHMRAQEFGPGEASAKKMHAALTGGSEMGPSQLEGQQVQQANALNKQADIQSAQQAQQAQGKAAQSAVPASIEAPGPAGENVPFAAQQGPQPQPSGYKGPPTQPTPQPQQPPPPGPGGPPGPGEQVPG